MQLNLLKVKSVVPPDVTEAPNLVNRVKEEGDVNQGVTAEVEVDEHHLL